MPGDLYRFYHRQFRDALKRLSFSDVETFPADPFDLTFADSRPASALGIARGLSVTPLRKSLILSIGTVY